jgi:putative SOS response-associated peptidase YedK
MCGRFTQHYTWAEVHEFLSVFGTPRNLRPRYNIGPTTDVDVVRLGTNGRELVSMRWGLAPFFWKKTLKELPATFNARAETIAEKPMFRDAYKKRRCIIPASGFYEWTGPKGDKQPHLFTSADGSPILAFAGLWDNWHDPAANEDILSCTIIVTDATEWMRSYHERMPVLLSPGDIEGWLAGSLKIADLKSASATALRRAIVLKNLLLPL